MAQQTKGYKGIGMTGPIARWYAKGSENSPGRYEDQAAQVIEHAPPGADVLEVAPGPGYLSIALAKTGDYTVTGLDISPTFVEIARKNAAGAGARVDFRHGNASAMPFESGGFDFVVCCAAFKNFSEPVRAIREMHRVLRPGGQALIIDLRHDPSRQAVQDEVARMNAGRVNAAVTRFLLRGFLARRAYDAQRFEDFVSQTEFGTADIRESGIGLEVLMCR